MTDAKDLLIDLAVWWVGFERDEIEDVRLIHTDLEVDLKDSSWEPTYNLKWTEAGLSPDYSELCGRLGEIRRLQGVGSTDQLWETLWRQYLRAVSIHYTHGLPRSS
jgi:hypothetical protein